MRPWRYVRVVANNAIVVYACARIHDTAYANHRVRLDDSPSHHHCSALDDGARRYHRARMNYRRRPEAIHSLSLALAGRVIPYPNDRELSKITAASSDKFAHHLCMPTIALNMDHSLPFEAATILFSSCARKLSCGTMSEGADHACSYPARGSTLRICWRRSALALAISRSSGAYRFNLAAVPVQSVSTSANALCLARRTASRA